jgi:hypothetical protein
MPDVRWFIVLQIVIVVVGLLLGLTTELHGDVSATRALGMPLACAPGYEGEEPCWIAIGHPAALVFGYGVGLVFYGAVGVGLLFGVGQATAGTIAFGQAAFGLVFFVAQVGVGFSGLGQLAIGGITAGQGSVGKAGGPYFKWLNAELDAVLRPGKAR